MRILNVCKSLSYCSFIIFVFVCASAAQADIQKRKETTHLKSVVPVSGAHSGGTSVELYGSGFTSNIEIWFGDAKCEIKLITSNKLTCKTVAHKVGVVNVLIKTAGGKTLAKLERGFTFTDGKSFGSTMVSLGFSYITYKQTNIKDFSEMAVTAKASYLRLLPWARWTIGLSSFFTALPITTSIPGISARFLGINLRVGYQVARIKAPWELAVLTGWYYTSMFVTNDYLGFRNLAGPQLYPVLTRHLTLRDSAFCYAKYSPVTNGLSLSFLSFSDRELAAGGGWIHGLKNGHPLSVTLDVANIGFAYRSSTISSSSVSLGVLYGL